MKCLKAQELFSDYVVGLTDRAMSVSLENHMTDCAGCREEVAGLRRVWSSLDSLPTVEAPPYFHENLIQRIDMEQARAEEQARQRWSWRSLLRPRAPAFALAGLLVVAVLGMGGLHTSHASLDPLGSLLRAFRPDSSTAGVQPALQTSRAEWRPNGLGGGTLTVYLQAQSGAPVTVKALHYEQGGQKLTAIQSDLPVSTDHEITLSIPLEAHPASHNMTVLLSSPGSAQTVSVPVTLMEPVTPPANNRWHGK